MSTFEDKIVEDARRDPASFRSMGIDALVHWAVFEADPKKRDEARRAIRKAAALYGILPASIHDLYMAVGRGETGGFTVPAINVRMLAYDTARAIFRAAKKHDVGPFILEIARSEMGYTDQRPAEYAAVMLAAAIREGHAGPVFIQGDHFQVNAKKYAADPKPELAAIEMLIDESLAAGFYNIDIDTSTLVELGKANVTEEQRKNFENAAHFTAFIRGREPKGVTVSVGGEIGEVGKDVSSPEEFRAYMDGYRAALPKGTTGVSKISINTGTSHGGVVLPDGTVAKVSIDFAAMKAISKIARSEYGLAGAVQHGASTLPAEMFHEFPNNGACEVHLATEFQNMVYEHAAFPKELKEEMYAWLRKNAADEKKPKDTEEQFLYKARKKAIGPFKKAVWSLPEAVRHEIGAALERKFEYLFGKLRVPGTKGVVERHVRPVEVAVSAAAHGFVRDDSAGD
ncbi:MAG TPA: class II fructose-bisphosphate aldolase [Thermoanaerobaculia bacterium]|nr:class II fructose-bisphosphate aldolase [Thermoanaerobaculia bacterium]HQR67504.1 class II fructose-bisphosphate aldolase [Thermoanaerobaculia bacterium]